MSNKETYLKKEFVVTEGSIWGAGLRALFRTFFGMIGIALGIVPFVLIVGLAMNSDDGDMEKCTSPRVLAGPDGKKEHLKHDSPLILQINIHGMIGMKNLTGDKIIALLNESQGTVIDEGRIKAILLHINSGGGSAFDSDEIYRAIREYKERYHVPVYAFAEGLLASGAYYIAVGADKIYTTPVSVIGSVGVVVPTFLNFSKVLDSFEIESLTVSRGKQKDALNPLRPWTAQDKESLNPVVSHMYDVFVDIVATNRKQITEEKLRETFGAKIFPAPIALEHGYVDAIDATRASTLKDLADSVGLTTGAYQVIELEQKTWLADIFNENFFITPKAVNFDMNPLPQELRGKPLYLYDATL